MVKTIRITDDDLHSELLQIQGAIQAETGEYTSMENALRVIVDIYHTKAKRR